MDFPATSIMMVLSYYHVHLFRLYLDYTWALCNIKSIEVYCLHTILKGLFTLAAFASQNVKFSPLCMVLTVTAQETAIQLLGRFFHSVCVGLYVLCILPASFVKWSDRYDERHGDTEQSLETYCSCGNSSCKETKLYFWIVNCNNLILGSNIFYGQYQYIRIATIQHISFWNWMTAWIRNTNFTQL
jgi:hypothetical protein